MAADRTRFDLRLGLELSGGTVADLWWRYASFGGMADPELLADLVAGRVDCGAHEHDLVAQALNEVFLDHGVGTFPVGYSRDPGVRVVPATMPPSGRAAALVRFDARRAAKRSRAIARETAFLVDVAARLVAGSRELSNDLPARRADLNRRRGAAAAPAPVGG